MTHSDKPKPKEPSAEPCAHLSMIRDLPVRHCLVCGPPKEPTAEPSMSSVFAESFEAVCSERDSLKAEVEFWHTTADDRSRHILAVEAERDALDHGHREFAKEITDVRATTERLEYADLATERTITDLRATVESQKDNYHGWCNCYTCTQTRQKEKP